MMLLTMVVKADVYKWMGGSESGCVRGCVLVGAVVAATNSREANLLHMVPTSTTTTPTPTPTSTVQHIVVSVSINHRHHHQWQAASASHM